VFPAVVWAANVNVKMRNTSGKTIAVYWVHPTSKETVFMKELPHNPDNFFSMNSFLGHTFQVFDASDASCKGEDVGESSDGGEQTCKTNYFEVTTQPEFPIVIKEDLVIAPDDFEERIKKENPVAAVDFSVVQDPMEVLSKCKAEAASRLEKVMETNASNNTVMEQEKEKVLEALHLCTTTKLVPKIKKLSDEVSFQREIRVSNAANSENFTCANPLLETTPDVHTREWTSPKDNVTRVEHLKLDRPASKIIVVENFASRAECDAMQEEAQSKLSVASTADGKGGTKISLSRKALQAAITPQFNEDGSAVDGNLIAVLSGRVYEYANHVLNMNLTHHGQEYLMSIQYFGRGYNDTEPDRYTPHCDGKCEGMPHIDGARMATTVIYCDIPEEGGFTNFQNANVHVKPSPGSAVFFSYIDPLTNLTDLGLTQHSGCPVYVGTKRIITQWIRWPRLQYM
ncbi:MAG: hypothetical protein SGILL_007417, partial [Bacillariaceae sp.]